MTFLLCHTPRRRLTLWTDGTSSLFEQYRLNHLLTQSVSDKARKMQIALVVDFFATLLPISLIGLIDLATGGQLRRRWSLPQVPWVYESDLHLSPWSMMLLCSKTSFTVCLWISRVTKCHFNLGTPSSYNYSHILQMHYSFICKMCVALYDYEQGGGIRLVKDVWIAHCAQACQLQLWLTVGASWAPLVIHQHSPIMWSAWHCHKKGPFK